VRYASIVPSRDEGGVSMKTDLTAPRRGLFVFG